MEIIFDDYVNGARLVIKKLDNNRIKIWDYENNFNCEFHKDRVRAFILAIGRYINAEPNNFEVCRCGSEVAVNTSHLKGIRGYYGNWLQIHRIPIIIEKLKPLINGEIKVDKVRSRSQLKRCKLSTLISIAKNIDIRKELSNIT